MFKKLGEEKAIVFHYDPYIPKFINNEKECKSLKKLIAEEVKEKDTVIITTEHTAVNCEMIIKNVKSVFDIRNVVKFENKKIKKL